MLFVSSQKNQNPSEPRGFEKWLGWGLLGLELHVAFPTANRQTLFGLEGQAGDFSPAVVALPVAFKPLALGETLSAAAAKTIESHLNLLLSFPLLEVISKQEGLVF